VTQLYLTLLDHAVASTAEAHRILHSEEKKAGEKRDAFRLASALHLAHLSIEKLVKHAVAKTDPVLLLKDPKPVFLRKLRKEVLQRHLPTIFASRQQLDSMNAEKAWEALVELLEPKIDKTTRDSFEQALDTLADLRNRAQHAELYEDDEEVISTLRRLFSKLPAISDAIAPEFLPLLQERHESQYAELRGIEQDVTGAWWALEARLAKQRTIEIPVQVYVTLRPSIPTVQVSFTVPDPGGGQLGLLAAFGKPTFRLTAEIEKENATGIFSREITAEEAKERDTARREVVRRNLPPDPPFFPDFASEGQKPAEAPKPLTGLLEGIVPVGRATAVAHYQDAIFSLFSGSYEREREHIEKHGMPPLEAGKILLRRAPAWVKSSSSGKWKSISGDVLLAELEIELVADEAQGRARGSILPPRFDPARPPIPMKLEGEIWLTNELVVTEPPTGGEDLLPVGMVIRYLKGKVRLLAAEPESAEAEHPVEG
jgi:hypothetical protein